MKTLVFLIVLVILGIFVWKKIQEHKKLKALGYHGSSVGNRSITNGGEAVRSSSERFIADNLKANGIRYEYEKTIFDKNGTPILNPDFYLPKYNLYLEFWGEIDSKYKAHRIEKQALYKKLGYNVVDIYPEDIWYGKSKTGKTFPLFDKVLGKIKRKI